MLRQAKGVDPQSTKFEYRNSKQYRMTEIRMFQTMEFTCLIFIIEFAASRLGHWIIRASDFFRVSDFDIRIWPVSVVAWRLC